MAQCFWKPGTGSEVQFEPAATPLQASEIQFEPADAGGCLAEATNCRIIVLACIMKLITCNFAIKTTFWSQLNHTFAFEIDYAYDPNRERQLRLHIAISAGGMCHSTRCFYQEPEEWNTSKYRNALRF